MWEIRWPHGPTMCYETLRGDESCIRCVSLCLCRSVSLSLRLSVTSRSVCLSVCLSTCLPACLPACLSVCLFCVYHLCTYLFSKLSTHLFICPFTSRVNCLCISVSVHLYTSLFIHSSSYVSSYQFYPFNSSLPCTSSLSATVTLQLQVRPLTMPPKLPSSTACSPGPVLSSSLESFAMVCHDSNRAPKSKNPVKYSIILDPHLAEILEFLIRHGKQPLAAHPRNSEYFLVQMVSGLGF